MMVRQQSCEEKRLCAHKTKQISQELHRNVDLSACLIDSSLQTWGLLKGRMWT